MTKLRTKRPSLFSRWLWWILPLLVFGAIIVSLQLLRVSGPKLPSIVLGVTIITLFGWIFVSVFYPARADRTCPECKEEALERLDLNTTRGVTCSRCGHTDPDETSWFMAEEETVLEEIVLAERARLFELEPEELARDEETTQNTETN